MLHILRGPIEAVPGLVRADFAFAPRPGPGHATERSAADA